MNSFSSSKKRKEIKFSMFVYLLCSDFGNFRSFFLFSHEWKIQSHFNRKNHKEFMASFKLGKWHNSGWSNRFDSIQFNSFAYMFMFTVFVCAVRGFDLEMISFSKCQCNWFELFHQFGFWFSMEFKTKTVFEVAKWMFYGLNIDVKRPHLWKLKRYATHIQYVWTMACLEKEFRVILIDGISFGEFDMMHANQQLWFRVISIV